MSILIFVCVICFVLFILYYTVEKMLDDIVEEDDVVGVFANLQKHI